MDVAHVDHQGLAQLKLCLEGSLVFFCSTGNLEETQLGQVAWKQFNFEFENN